MHLHLYTYGAYLHIKDQLFEVRVRDKEQVRKQQFAANRIQSIWMDEGTALSSAAVVLAIKNNIDIVFLEKSGRPLGRVWHSKLGSTTLIRKKQLEASLNSLGLAYTKMWLGQKIEHQAQFIQQLAKHRPGQVDFLTEKRQQLLSLKQSIEMAHGSQLDSLAEQFRGWEGTAGRLYFQTISHVLPKQYQFVGRSFRPARDPFNAFLNYAYGILYSRVEKALILAGLDPYVGFLHRDDYNYKSMVYDFIEPYRAYADKIAFSLFTAKKVRQSHTTLSASKACTLTREGKVLLVSSFNKYMEEDRVRYKGKNQTRANIIQLAAHRFAQELLQKEAPC
ncbi:MAG: CRISPR-associated endonuclease Cas1 [Bacteroidota bacterium]